MAGEVHEAMASDDIEGNPDNYNNMHFACLNQRVEEVQALIKSHPGLCLEKDKHGRIPLHIAAMEGPENVVRALVSAYPESVKLTTCLGDTAFHRALKNGQRYCFKVLMEVLHNFPNVNILNQMDSEGNTVLHIAVGWKMIPVVKILVGDNFKSGPVVQVKAKNGRGLTALQLFYENNSESVNGDDKYLGELLRDAEAKEGTWANRSSKEKPSHSRSLQPESPKFMTTSLLENTSLAKKALLMAVFVSLGMTAFGCLLNLDNNSRLYPHLENKTLLAILDIVSPPYMLPGVFYFLLFDKLVFLVSEGVIVFITWSLVDQWSLCYRALPGFAMIMIFLGYEVLLNNSLPKFWVAVGSLKIPSFWFLWLCELLLLFFLALIWMVGEVCISCKPSGKPKTGGNRLRTD